MKNVSPVGSPPTNAAGMLILRPRALALAISAAFGVPQLAFALPTGGQVVSGSSTITRIGWLTRMK